MFFRFCNLTIDTFILCKFDSVDATQAQQLMQLLDLVVNDLAD